MSGFRRRVRTSYRGDPTAACQQRLVAHLTAVVGPELTSEAARMVLERAKVWTFVPMRQLDQHLATHPDALTAPDPHAPKALFRLIFALHDAEFAHAVTLPRCPGCGQVKRDLAACGRLHPDGRGRCCQACMTKVERVRCARCELASARAAARRPEGVICGRCYWKDAGRQQRCAGCGQLRTPNRRNGDGSPLCQACAPRPTRVCAGCGRSAPAHGTTPAGAVCRRCYQQPQRICGGCGRLRPIKRRAHGNDPDLCASCNQPPATQCTICGRVRLCTRGRDGNPRCASCTPRLRRECAVCGRRRTTQAFWPIGPVCSTCYIHAVHHPGACAACSQVRVLVDRNPVGEALCGRCAVHRVVRDRNAAGLRAQFDFFCSACEAAGTYAAGRCARCVLTDRVTDLLGDQDGAIARQLLPFADVLINTATPRQVVMWLERSAAARLLARLAASPEPVTHELLDQLPRPAKGGAVDHLRKLLVAAGVLPQRLEPLARLESWLDTQLAGQPPDHRRLVLPFAQWVVLRRARRDAARGRYTHNSPDHDREQIRHALLLLSWLRERGLTIAELTQALLDQWMTEGAMRRRGCIRAFVSWSAARKITPALAVARQRDDTPSRFLAEEDHVELLRRCLTEGDAMLPLEVKVAGALILLYGLRSTKIVSLTADRVVANDRGTYLIIDKIPVLLPPNLARLVQRLIRQPPHRLNVSTCPAHDGPTWLFPGVPPTQPLSPGALAARLRGYGIHAGAARNTALIFLAADLPAPVAADLFGLHRNTATAWSRYAQADWTAYLNSRPRAQPDSTSR